MPTDTGPPPTSADRFLLRAVAWSIGLFGLLRLSWTETHILLPLTRAQAGLATELFGAPAVPVVATLACSSADALALCVGAVLAYPGDWRRRLNGALAGTVLILILNTLRIGSLGRAGASPVLFNTLHVYIWPAALTLSIAAYVFTWMWLEDRRQTTGAPAATPRPARRFIVRASVLLLLFVAVSPLYFGNPLVVALAGFIASAAAATLHVAGVTGHAAGSVLWTSSGGFLVTPECISTPLIPVYVAAVWTFSMSRRRLMLGLVATVPLFIVLAIVRLLVVAVPATASSPYLMVHAFNQVLAAVVIVALAAVWRHGGGGSLGPALSGVAVGCLFVQLAGPFYTDVITATALKGVTTSVTGGVALDDPQGAIALLPGFQIGLYLALWVAAFIAVTWRRVLAGLALLGLTQAAGLMALHFLAANSGLTAHVRDIRGWAVAAPVLIFALAVNRDRARR